MQNQANKIFLNTSFDRGVLKLILKRNWYWCLLISILLFVGAFIYLRYTKPIYESSILIQVNSEDQGADLLGMKTGSEDNSLAKEVELLRSQLLFKRAIGDLPLEITCFTKGDFLTELNYKHGVYDVVPLFLKDSSVVGKKTWLTVQQNEIKLVLQIGEKEIVYHVKPNGIIETPYYTVKIKVNNLEEFEKLTTNDQVYFQFNDKRRLASSLLDKLSVEAIDRNAKTIGVRYKGNNSRLSKDIVSSVVANFFQYDEELKKESDEKKINFIDLQLDSLRKEIEVSKDSIMAFQRRESITNPEQMSSSVSSKIEFLHQQETELVDEMEALDIIKTRLDKNPNSMDVYRLIPILMGKSFENSLNEQIQNLYELIERKEDLLYDVKPTNSNVLKLETRIETRKENVKTIISLLDDKLNRKHKILTEEIAKAERKYFVLPEKQMELSRLNNIKELNDKYFALLTERKVMYSITNAGYSSDNKILNDATESNSPVFPVPSTIYGVTLFLAFSLTTAFLLVRYLSFNEINNISDLQSLLPERVNVLGDIPFVRDKMDYSQIIVNDKPKSMVSESFRMIRTNLHFIHKDVKSISVTSTIPGEGKTFVVLNLAGIIAMSGKRVIVVDLDLRKPKIHLGFNEKNKIGMSNILAGLNEIKEAVQHSEVNNLDFISAGPIPPNPSELLLGERFEKVKNKLQELYDVVLFDNPPVGLVSDGVRLLGNVDVPIYVFRANYSKRALSQKLNEIAQIEEIKNLSVVLNGVDMRFSGYGRRYGYGYGYGYHYGGYYVEK